MPNCLQIDCIINNAHRGPIKASFVLIPNSIENVSGQGAWGSWGKLWILGRVKCKIFQQSTPYVIWQTTNFGNKSNNRRRALFVGGTAPAECGSAQLSSVHFGFSLLCGHTKVGGWGGGGAWQERHTWNTEAV